MKRTAVARWTFEGFHRWPLAPPARDYLAAKHRHLFYAQVEIEQYEGDREVEFHDLLATARAAVKGPSERDFGELSCEALAAIVARRVRSNWPDRRITVQVFEDGECGARMTWGADERIQP